MDLNFEHTVAWDDTIPPAFPTEIWSMVTVYYDFTFEMNPDLAYIAVPGSQAQFTVRNVGTDDAPEWRLLEWRDLAGGSLVRMAVGTDATTWGSIKGLYYAGE